MVRAQLRAELLKQRSTRTVLGLFAAMLGLIVLAILLHALALPAEGLASTQRQLMVFGRPPRGVVDHQRVPPRDDPAHIPRQPLAGSRRRGEGLGEPADRGWVRPRGLCARGGGRHRGASGARDPPPAGWRRLCAPARWGCGGGRALGWDRGRSRRRRSPQVPTLIGISAWLLFVEGLLVGDAAGAVAKVGRFFPGAAATAITGQGRGTLVAPVVGLVLLAIYAAGRCPCRLARNRPPRCRLVKRNGGWQTRRRSRLVAGMLPRQVHIRDGRIETDECAS